MTVTAADPTAETPVPPATTAPATTAPATIAPATTDTRTTRTGHALRRRYGTDDDTLLARIAQVTPVIEVQLEHRSVRHYLPRPLDPGVVPTLVAAAQSAPTSSNPQLWSVVAVTDHARKDRLADLAGGQAHIRQAPLLLVWVADVARARALGTRSGVHLEGTDYLETTVVAFLDAALAAQNALLAAESLGLGTVYIGAIRNRPTEVAAELGLPDGVVAVVGLVVGHPDPEGRDPVKPRLPQAAVLHPETYDASGHDEHLDTYEERIAPFYAGEGLAGGWAERVVNRLRGISSLNGRERLREALSDRGFPSN